MKRRALLAGLTGSLSALAGCNGLGEVVDRQTREPFRVETTATEREPQVSASPPTEPSQTAFSLVEGPPRRLAVGDVTDGQDGLSATVGFTGDGSTGTPPRLWVGVTNTFPSGGEFQFPGLVPFDGLVGRRPGDDLSDADTMVERPQLVLVPLRDERFASVRPADPEDGCWLATDAIPTDVDGIEVTIESDQTVGREYLVLTDPGSDTCLQPGVYRFESAVPNLSFGISVWNPEQAQARESVFAGDANPFPGGLVPSLPDCSAAWFHQAREAGAEAFLAPAQERIELPETVDVTLQRYGEGTVRPTRLQLYRRQDERWVPIRPPAGVTRQYDPLTPGWPATRTLALGADAGVLGTGSGTLGLPGLRPGTYAVRFGKVERERGSTCLAALLSLAGGDADLTPTNHVEDTDRDGETYLVLSRRRRPDDPLLECTRVGDTGDRPDETLILEQVMQLDGLRNTLTYLRADDSLSAVYLQTSPRVVQRALGAVGLERARRRRFVFDGTAYQVRRTRRGL
ncbi:hypothetical protein [Haloarchaeobius amylolyticus]|uniref:hypothetical protein n=1 Tax=Haloarchaeobius amylolyticus TaxID=1198296 RepID=UPI00226D8B1D|nr:hypothetical protein [Haloarchaeobius amylolyticus]